MVPENIKELFRRAKAYVPTIKKGRRVNDENLEALNFLVDSEPRNDNRLIEQYCITPAQRKWMQDRRLTVESMVSGHYAIGDSPTVHALYKDWNQKLGVKWFQEDDEMQGMWDAISNTFGEMGVKNVQFGDGEPVELGGNIAERFGGEAPKNENSTIASDVLKLIAKTKKKLQR